jgi:uncharacterized protein YndB with AHSA1/START domain
MVVSERSEPALGSQLSVVRKSDRELVVTRTFNGPARIVFDAWTKPELVRRWWAPKSRGVTMAGCEADVRVGGSYRYVVQPPRGDAFGMSGQYTEVTPPSRLVYTQVFEPMAHLGAAIVTVTFDEEKNVTRLQIHSLYPSKESLDGAIAMGMEDGMHETLDQLDALVVSLAARAS